MNEDPNKLENHACLVASPQGVSVCVCVLVMTYVCCWCIKMNMNDWIHAGMVKSGISFIFILQWKVSQWDHCLR